MSSQICEPASSAEKKPVVELPESNMKSYAVFAGDYEKCRLYDLVNTSSKSKAVQGFKHYNSFECENIFLVEIDLKKCFSTASEKELDGKIKELSKYIIDNEISFRLEGIYNALRTDAMYCRSKGINLLESDKHPELNLIFSAEVFNAVSTTFVDSLNLKDIYMETIISDGSDLLDISQAKIDSISENIANLPDELTDDYDNQIRLKKSFEMEYASLMKKNNRYIYQDINLDKVNINVIIED